MADVWLREESEEYRTELLARYMDEHDVAEGIVEDLLMDVLGRLGLGFVEDEGE